jgi:GNAT superfamily N-acetyltransferase
MQAADAARAAALAAELGYAGASADLIAARLAAVAGRADHAVWVSADADAGDGDLLGLIHAQHMDRIISDPYVEILHLVVAARARRGGVGRTLVARVLVWAGERGLDRVRVRSNIVRPEAHDFYLALGFARHKTQHVYTATLPRSGSRSRPGS